MDFPIVLADDADSHFSTNLKCASRRGGVTCRPEAVQYLLRKYETLSAMREVLDELRTNKHQENEFEESYRKKISNAIHACGNVHGEDEKTNLYIDWLSQTTGNIFRRHREIFSRRYVTFK